MAADAELDRHDALRVEGLMRQVLSQGPTILGDEGPGSGKTVLKLSTTRRGLPVKLVCCPLEIGDLCLNAVLSVDQGTSDSLVVMRLRCCVPKLLAS